MDLLQDSTVQAHQTGVISLAAGVNYLPGDPLRLEAIVRNRGNVAVSNMVVGFYDGPPDAGGVLLINVTLSGWLGAVATSATSATGAIWVVPTDTMIATRRRRGSTPRRSSSSSE